MRGGHITLAILLYSVVFSFSTCSARAIVYSAATAGAAARLAATCLAMVSNSRWPVCVMKRPLTKKAALVRMRTRTEHSNANTKRMKTEHAKSHNKTETETAIVLAVLLLGDDVDLAKLLEDVSQHTACSTARSKNNA